VNMECTNGQPAGYRRHREQSNPNAASRDQNGANKNPLHHRGFYRPPGFSCKSPHDTEPTSGLEPLTCSLRVINRVFHGLAGVCKTRISRRLSLLWLAPCCTALRSRWCQSGVNRGIAASRSCSPEPEPLSVHGLQHSGTMLDHSSTLSLLDPYHLLSIRIEISGALTRQYRLLAPTLLR
jgi:hypothetical protein